MVVCKGLNDGRVLGGASQEFFFWELSVSVLNVSVRKMPRCNIQLCEEEMVEDKKVDEKINEEEHKGVSVKFEDKDFGENI